MPAQTDRALLASLESELHSIDAVTGVQIEDTLLKIDYLFPDICFDQIWQLIKLKTDTSQLSLPTRLVYTLIAYTETIEQEHLQAQVGWDIYVRDIYVSSYRQQSARRANQKRKPWQQVKRPVNPQ